MPHHIDWRHFVAFGGTLVSLTLPYLLFPREEEYEYIEIVEEELDDSEIEDTEPKTEKETADDQQDD